MGAAKSPVKPTTAPMIEKASPNPKCFTSRPAAKAPKNIPAFMAVLKTPIVEPMPKDRPLSRAIAEVVGMKIASITPIDVKMIITCQNLTEKPKMETNNAMARIDNKVSTRRLYLSASHPNGN